METLLIIEDDEKLAELISDYMLEQGFTVHHANNGAHGLHLAGELKPDLIILDLMMPILDGLSVCRHLQTWFTGRILILTASDSDMDQVAALEMGAHDFVNKPLHPRVLLARVRALLRRDAPQTPVPHLPQENVSNPQDLPDHQVSYGELMIQHKRRQITLAGQSIILTDAEFDLLWLLATHPEEPLSRDRIMKTLRGIEYDGIDRSVDNRVLSLRKKLNDSAGIPKRIITVRGKGYMFITDAWG